MTRGTPAAVRPPRMTGDARPPGQVVTLAQLAPGCRALLTGFAVAAPPSIVRRLEDLGFAAGTEVEVARRAPLRDPLIYRVRDYDICLRRAEAAYLLVREIRR
ncbi:FeoA family protein [Actinoplanes sp. NPDC048791]|uniref:FeoA family protein n=1 Tax=Actinoplanes sp. NPDC048791 TaxID=3154623 RepID=UPI0033D5ECE8